MTALKIMPRSEAVSAAISPFPPSPGKGTPLNHKRRASDSPDRVDRRAPAANPLSSSVAVADFWRVPDLRVAESRSIPEQLGSLLVVQDATAARHDLESAGRLAGLEVLLASDQREALQALKDGESLIDLLLVIHHSATGSSASALIRSSLAIHPGLHVLMMVDSGRQEAIRAGYDAGATSIILHGVSTEGLAEFLRLSLSAAREARSHDLRRRERNLRQASDSAMQRALRRIKSWVYAPSGSRRGAACRAVVMIGAALSLGMGLAFALEQSYRGIDRVEALSSRVLEGMKPFRGLDSDTRGAAILRWQMQQQIGLTREANEATSRYYQEHLQELRWQNQSRSSSPPEPIANPVPDRSPDSRR